MWGGGGGGGGGKRPSLGFVPPSLNLANKWERDIICAEYSRCVLTCYTQGFSVSQLTIYNSRHNLSDYHVIKQQETAVVFSIFEIPRQMTIYEVDHHGNCSKLP